MSVSAAHVVCCLLLLSAIASSCRSSGQTAGDSWTSRDAAAASTPVELFRQCAAKDAILANLVTFNPNNEAQQHNPENWNTYFDSIRHPAAVAHPTTTEQVSQLVKCAAAANLRFVVRGGGRSYEAMSTIHNGLLLDFGQMGSIQLLGRTTAAQTFNSSTTGSNTGSIEVFVVRVGAGARMGPIFAYLFKHGLMMEGATCAAVGIAGSTQGGGAGHSIRKVGFQSDHLIAATAVTSEGQVLNTSTTSHPDLFWAIRGGGANYGIITQFDFEVTPHPATISYGSLSWRPPSAETAANILKAFNHWQPWLLPDEVTRVHAVFWSDQIIVEVFVWDTEQAVSTLLDTFPSRPGMSDPKRMVFSWSWERYMLSSAVTNCYGVPDDQWTWANVSSSEAVLQAEQAWRDKYTNGSWPFAGGSAIFMGSMSNSTSEAFARVAMPRIAQGGTFSRAALVTSSGVMRQWPNNYTGYGYRQLTMHLKVGTLLRSSNDSNWVNAALDSLMPDSQGRRDWNHIMCLNSSVDPWTAYFGDHAERLKAVKQRYDPHNRVNALDCALLEAA